MDLFVSPAIQKELSSVLRHAFGWTATEVREALAEVNALASLVKPSVRLSGILAYGQDHRILECALAARAQFWSQATRNTFNLSRRFVVSGLSRPENSWIFFIKAAYQAKGVG